MNPLLKFLNVCRFLFGLTIGFDGLVAASGHRTAAVWVGIILAAAGVAMTFLIESRLRKNGWI